MFARNILRALVLPCLFAILVSGSSGIYRDYQGLRNPRHASCPSCRRERPDALVSWELEPVRRDFRAHEPQFGPWSRDDFQLDQDTYDPYDRAVRSRGGSPFDTFGDTVKREDSFALEGDVNFDLAPSPIVPTRSLESPREYQPRYELPRNVDRPNYLNPNFYNQISRQTDLDPLNRYRDDPIYGFGSPPSGTGRPYDVPSRKPFQVQRYPDRSYNIERPMVQPQPYAKRPVPRTPARAPEQFFLPREQPRESPAMYRRESLSMYHPRESPAMYQPRESLAMAKSRVTPAMYQSRETPAMYQPRESLTISRSRETPAMYQSRETPSMYQPRESSAMSKPRETPAMYQSRESPAMSQSRVPPAMYQSRESPSMYPAQVKQDSYNLPPEPNAYRTQSRDDQDANSSSWREQAKRRQESERQSRMEQYEGQQRSKMAQEMRQVNDGRQVNGQFDRGTDDQEDTKGKRGTSMGNGDVEVLGRSKVSWNRLTESTTEVSPPEMAKAVTERQPEEVTAKAVTVP